jgi:hypothetical protein
MKRTCGMKRTPMKKRPRKTQPGDDPQYEAWIRTLPCFCCFVSQYKDGQIKAYILSGGDAGDLPRFQQSRTECAHLGDRGLGALCPSRETGPLCMEHHREGVDSHHGRVGKGFWKHHGIQRKKLFEILHEIYEAQI